MEVQIAATLYFSFAAFLILPHFGAPAVCAKMAISLCAAELVATLVWSFGRQGGCADGGCPVVDTAEVAAGIDIPIATVLTLIITAAYGLFVVRNW